MGVAHRKACLESQAPYLAKDGSSSESWSHSPTQNMVSRSPNHCGQSGPNAVAISRL